MSGLEFTTIKHASLDRLYDLVSDLHRQINNEFDPTPKVLDLLEIVNEIFSELDFIDSGAEKDWEETETK